MTGSRRSLPKWILIVSGLFALLELIVSLALCFSPQSVLETVDLNAKGVDYLIYMWAARQFALGFIFGFATFKKSIPMLTIAYIFFPLMQTSLNLNLTLTQIAWVVKDIESTKKFLKICWA